MRLFQLRFAPLTNLAMLLLQNAASLVYITLFNAFITATYCTVHEVADAGSTTHRIAGICCLASTPILGNTAPGVKYEAYIKRR